MFFKGLRSILNDICRHIYDKTLTFDELRSAVRKIELEHQRTPCREKTLKQATANVAQSMKSNSMFESLEAKNNQLTTEVKELNDHNYLYNRQRYQQNDGPLQQYRGGQRGKSDRSQCD